MKKTKIKLRLNKHKVSSFKMEHLKGGTNGTTCKYTNKYYNTCLPGCEPDPTQLNCITDAIGCPSGNTCNYCHH